MKTWMAALYKLKGARARVYCEEHDRLSRFHDGDSAYLLNSPYLRRLVPPQHDICRDSIAWREVFFNSFSVDR